MFDACYGTNVQMFNTLHNICVYINKNLKLTIKSNTNVLIIRKEIENQVNRNGSLGHLLIVYSSYELDDQMLHFVPYFITTVGQLTGVA